MKTAFINAFVCLTALIFAACGTPEKATDTNISTGAAKPAAVAPTANALLALDKQATAAYLTSDSKLFEGLLNESSACAKAAGRWTRRRL